MSYRSSFSAILGMRPGHLLERETAPFMYVLNYINVRLALLYYFGYEYKAVALLSGDNK